MDPQAALDNIISAWEDLYSGIEALRGWTGHFPVMILRQVDDDDDETVEVRVTGVRVRELDVEVIRQDIDLDFLTVSFDNFYGLHFVDAYLRRWAVAED